MTPAMSSKHPLKLTYFLLHFIFVVIQLKIIQKTVNSIIQF